MRVFVTGATGFVGSAVVNELINAGHNVVGLARSDSAAKSLFDAGAEVHRGSLKDLESLKSGAMNSDGVIHTGFIHDFLKFKESCEIDRRAIEALGSGLVGSNKKLIITSGIGLLLPQGKIVDENSMPSPDSLNPRVATEEASHSLLNLGVNMSLLRLPPSVHGDGDHGFVPILINIAREKGVSAYIGEGNNYWTAVHLLDAAKLFRLVLEKGAAGSQYHGVAEESVAFKKIAEVIGKRLNVPVVGMNEEEATNNFTWFTHFAKIDCLASSKITQDELGWYPTHSNLITDIDRDIYFKI